MDDVVGALLGFMVFGPVVCAFALGGLWVCMMILKAILNAWRD